MSAVSSAARSSSVFTVERVVGVELSDRQARAVDVVAEGFGRAHNWVLADDAGIVLLDDGVRVRFAAGVSVSSFDTDELTRLVVAAHERLVRVELGVWHADVDEMQDDAEEGEPPVLFGMWVLATCRSATGDLYSRHPSIGDLAGRCR